jgi:NAD(P)-dependent dehydrogenase (short-subunit alcohol dehydrogenase family)
LEGFSEALAKEVAPLGIHVTIVEPGYFRTDLLADYACKFAVREIEDYAATSGAVRKAIPTMHGKQPGDPRKLAFALVRLVCESKPPLRFLAGADAVQVREQTLNALREEIEEWRELSISLAFEE